MFEILLLEDSLDFHSLVSKTLAPFARISAAETVQEALGLLQHKKFALLIVDVVLNDEDGFNFVSDLRKLPEYADLRVIFMTSKDQLADRMMGYGLGAEDYIVKPFDLAEFRLRIESRLQRWAKETPGVKNILRGNLLLDWQRQGIRLVKENEVLSLTPLQFKLLYILASKEQQIVSRHTLIEDVWGKDMHIGRSVDTHINAIRRKLGSYSGYIQSVYGLGYQFSSLDSE